jgi:hypothetical protein
MQQPRKRWFSQILKTIRKRKVARNPKRKDCGKMEGTTGSSSMSWYKDRTSSLVCQHCHDTGV